MRAVTFYEYGPPSVLRVEQRPAPDPGPGQVRVRCETWALNAADWRVLRADPWLVRLSTGLFTPKRNVLGCDLAGVAEAVGPGVSRCRPGDAVMGDLSNHGFGAFADELVAPERALTRKPDHVSFEHAAAAPLAGVTALQALVRHGRVAAGERVLIHGASGGVGTFALQLARYLGARVTAVCSASNADLALQLGAEEVIDYAREDFSRREGGWDLILATNGDRRLADYVRALAPGGRYLMVGGSWRQMKEAMFRGPLTALGSGKSVRFHSAASTPQDLDAIGRLLADGSIRSVIDRSFPLERTAEAIAYLEEGHARGKVTLTREGS